MVFIQQMMSIQPSPGNQQVLYAWGLGLYGAKGDLSNQSTSSPVAVQTSGITKWLSIAAGQYHALGIKTDYTLWVWGLNIFGQLGLGYQTNIYSSAVVASANLAWSKLEAGLAIKTDGTLWQWGGDLGDMPVLVSGPANTSWSAISSWDFATRMAITTEGRLYAWGSNSYGQLGDLSTVDKSTPVLVSGPANTSWVAVKTGYHTLAITTAGRLYAWGYNNLGQLGDLSKVNKSSPVLVSGPASTSWNLIATGGQHSLATTTAGRLWGWGSNQFYGTIGDATLIDKSSPVLVSGPATTSWSVIAAGSLNSFGITTAGRLYGWGFGSYGAVGNGSTATVSSPILVSGPASTSWTTVSSSSGMQNAYAITTLGRLYAWGVNDSGQVGNGQVTAFPTVVTSPVLVSGPAATSWNLVVATGGGALAVNTSNTVYGWGLNSNQQINAAGISSPVQLGTSSWTFVGASFYSSAAIDVTGRLFAWGWNPYGQLGDLTIINKSSPTLVSGPSSTSWSAVSLGGYTTYAITNQGRLYAWGYNASGQVGDLTTVNKSSPVLVSGPVSASWSAVSAGNEYAIALRTNGSLWTWGENGSGQLGNGSTVDTSSPVNIGTFASWSVITTGEVQSLAITSVGRLYAWGNNSFGQLGDLTTVSKSTPVLVSGPAATSWSAVGGSMRTPVAITRSGLLYAWGWNSNGQLGDLTTVNKSSPVLVSGPAAIQSWSLVSINNGGRVAFARSA